MKRILKVSVLIIAIVIALCSCSAMPSYNGGSSAYEKDAMDAPMQPGNKTSYNDAGDPGFELAVDENAKIVWKGNVTFETTVWDDTMREMRAFFAECGASIMSSEESGGNRYETSGKVDYSAKSLRCTVRVPSENFAVFMDGFGKITGSVVRSSTSRSDMTKQYNSNELSLELLHTEYEDLKALLAKAETLEEIMTVRERMTEVMKEIRTLSQANNDIDYDVAFSEVSLAVTEVKIYSDPEKTESWTERIGKSFKDGIDAFVSFLDGASVWIVGNVILLAFLALSIWLPIFLIRRGVRKRRAAAAAARAEQEEKK